VIPAMLDNATQGELTRYESNYKALNLVTIALGRNVYDRVAHLETAHDVWLKLCNTYECSSEIKSSRKDKYNRQYQIFAQKTGESLDDCFGMFELIVSSLHSWCPLAYSDNEHAKQLLYALDDSVWGMKITALEESVDFATIDIEKLFSKLKSHELSKKGHPNHDASLSSKALITSARIGGHDANPTNTIVSYTLEFALSSLAAASDEQYKSIPDDEIALLVRKFHELQKFRKERRRSPRATLSVTTPPTSSPTAPRGRNSTPPTSMTTPSRTTTTRATIRRSTTSGTRSFRWLPPVPHGDTAGHSVHRVPLCMLSGLSMLFTLDDSLANLQIPQTDS
jgi:hypothetical protein